MKTPAAALLALLLAAACGPVPGGRLEGTLAPVPGDCAVALGGDRAFCEIEARPADPHSIQLECFLLEGHLYAQSHRWALASWWPVTSWAAIWIEHPDVKVRIGEGLYELRAVYVTDPKERESVLEYRGYRPAPEGIALFRFEPRPPASTAALDHDAHERLAAGRPGPRGVLPHAGRPHRSRRPTDAGPSSCRIRLTDARGRARPPPQACKVRDAYAKLRRSAPATPEPRARRRGRGGDRPTRVPAFGHGTERGGGRVSQGRTPSGRFALAGRACGSCAGARLPRHRSLLRDERPVTRGGPPGPREAGPGAPAALRLPRGPARLSLLSEVIGVLAERGVPHAVIGAAALAAHGVSRATADLDLLALGAGTRSGSGEA